MLKKEAIKDYFIVNGNIKSVKKSNIFKMIERPSIYEVIRIIDGVPLFLEEHLDRMYHSAELINYTIDEDKNKIKEYIKKLTLKNNVKQLNIKLLLGETKKKEKVFLVYFIESFYPPQDYYINGIHTILFDYERDNPNAKVLFSSFKDQVSKELKSQEAFEALLVNKSGYILEGSRSNIFFVKENKIYTAKAKDVLMGITREYIYKICEGLSIEIIEESMGKDELHKLEGAFMTGTSVNVLPISTIGEIKLNSIKNRIIREINNSYKIEMENYLLENKNIWK